MSEIDNETESDRHRTKRPQDVPGAEDIDASRDDLHPATRAIVSRRNLLKGIGGTTAGLAAIPMLSTADEDEDEEEEEEEEPDGQEEEEVEPGYWLEQDYSDYVAQDEHENLRSTPSRREAAEMFIWSTPILGQAAIAGGAIASADEYDPGSVFESARAVVHDIYTDPFVPDSSALDEDVLVNAWWDLVDAERQLERDIDVWLDDFNSVEEYAHDAIEVETRAAFNDGASMSEAKSRCRTAVRELYATPEVNLFIYIEEVLIRLNGVYFQAAANTEGPGLWEYWDFSSAFMLSHDDEIEGLHGPSMHEARYDLMDGRTFDTGVLQLIYEHTEDYPDDDPDSAIAHPLIDAVDSERWDWLPDRPDAHTYSTTPVEYEPPSTVDDDMYRLLDYSSDLVDKAEEMYEMLWEKVGVMDDEIDAYVEDRYEEFGEEDEIPFDDLSGSAIRGELGMDWQQTGSTGFAVIEALRSGYRSNADMSMDVEVLGEGEEPGEGTTRDDVIVLTLGDWIPDEGTEHTYDLDTAVIDGSTLHVEGMPYDGDHVVEIDGEDNIHRDHGQLATSGEYMEADGGDVGFRIDLESDEYDLGDIEEVRASVNQGLFVDETYHVPEDEDEYPDAEIIVAGDESWQSLDRGEGVHILAVRDMDGEEIDALPIRDGGQTELSTDNTEEITRRAVWTASERDAEQEDHDVPHPGAGDPDDDNTLLLVGAAAAVAATAAAALAGDGGGETVTVNTDGGGE